ncbi:uncharacterized protein EAE97_011273 [Botrytis byssoidea]|uniref:Uncharacterized protein n=1 Tax=Botrytis byssoidea TaxID=139641 RepID=A0A9P5HYC0_9HELO|nr:uncharacterized protein EAE97_011273 [Botrytis byssoidea]KAF7921484.1 hypothetical protein EAE97_011273 [Botrytis byssoidea]
MADDRGLNGDSQGHRMSSKGGSEKIMLANLEIGSTISQVLAIMLDRHGLPLVLQPSLLMSKNRFKFGIYSTFQTLGFPGSV